jgi:hypothetical protein
LAARYRRPGRSTKSQTLQRLGCSPNCRSPKPVKTPVHSALVGSPPEFCIHLSRLSGPFVAGHDLPSRFWCPSTASLTQPLHEESCPPSPQCRSRVFSTPQRFQHRSSSTALFHAATVRGLPPFRAFPSRRTRTPLKAALLPCSYPPCRGNAPPATLSPAVSPTPTLLTQSPGSPTNYGSPFHESEGPLPGRPGSPTEGSPLPPASPASKLCSLHESVRTDSSCPEPSGRYSPGLLPLSRPNRPNLGSSNPPGPLRTQALILSRRIGFATPGTGSTPGAG